MVSKPAGDNKRVASLIPAKKLIAVTGTDRILLTDKQLFLNLLKSRLTKKMTIKNKCRVSIQGLCSLGKAFSF